MSDEVDVVQAMVDAMGSGEPAKAEPNAGVPESTKVDDAALKKDEPVSNDPVYSQREWDREIAGKAKLREDRRQLRSELAIANEKIASLEAKLNSSPPSIDDFGDDLDGYEEAVKKFESNSNARAVVDDVLADARQTLFDKADDWHDAPSDWKDVVTNADVPFSRDSIVAISDLDNGAEVLYALAKDKEAFDKIFSKRSPSMMARQLEKYAESLEPDGEKNVMADDGRQRNKPRPIEPVRSGGRGSSKNLESMSVADHMKASKQSFW